MSASKRGGRRPAGLAFADARAGEAGYNTWFASLPGADAGPGASHEKE